MAQEIGRIDLHMHSTVSDGTNTPAEILACAREAGLSLFSLTDHDAVKGCRQISGLRTESDPQFITGVEFSCKDEEGKYHILGYCYDPDAESVQEVVDTGHRYRMKKVTARLDFLKDEYGFVFPDEEIRDLMRMDNPGKPHIGLMMARHGYAENKEVAIRQFINKLPFRMEYVRPEEAIRGILGAGGIPVLAHPSYGSGDELIFGEEMDHRLKKLIGFGLEGVEAFYSGFLPGARKEILGLAEKYDLYVTAGSDYHGKNKIVEIGEIGVPASEERPAGMQRFLDRIGYKEPE